MNSLSDKTLTMNFEKLESRIICLILISLIYLPLSSQDKVFTLQSNADNRIVINKDVSGNIQLSPFKSDRSISGLTISCDITFNSDSSLVRIILVDEDYNEYLICEAYPLLNESNTFSLNDFAEETSYLLNIIPQMIEIEVVDASVFLKEITTRKEEKLITKATMDRSWQQNSEKIKRINENLKKKGGLWVAGETSVSKLTYKEKKELFGGRVPNLQGFEYYVGGIFVMPGALESEINVQDLSEQPSLSNASPFADEFSWRNRHGQDWVTSVKNQGWCGSCWAFGAIGATELLVNLYYNKHLDLNLSEQDLLSCSNSGNCSGGSGILALDYLTTAGAVDEDCFSYWANDLPCYDKCPNPNECIKISGKNVFTNNPENELKKMLISGPICGRVNAWSHLMTLVGYKVIQRGDNIYVKDNTHDYWITVTDDNPIIGKTAWLFKNSWSSEWGDSGYVYLVTSINGLDGSILALGPVISLKLNDSDISCIDADNDGYYSWGIGPKPPHCPPCPDEPDGDDSDPCLGPMDEFGHIQLFTYLPIAKDTIISAGDPVPDLCAEGENIRWYSDNK